jgi:ABC-type polysaccharide/polyol phosphate transport system ATPase subunit
MTVDTPAVALHGVGKRYTKYEDAPMLATAALRLRAHTRRSKLWALRDVNLEVGAGECVGVIGRNGSGKSTMLQLLAGVTAPTAGRVTVRGKVAPLISVGVGFHPELTGRENVYVNGSILGLTRREIDRRLENIIEFAEITGFIDTPVKFYSSGMYVRLGFAIAVNADPGVLLIDEVLAVGDVGFQMKCFERMKTIRESGTTVLVVSHNLTAVRRLCDRTTVLSGGRQHYTGDTDQAIAVFHELMREPREPEAAHPAGPWEGHRVDGLVTIESLTVHGPDNAPTAHVQSRDDVVFRVGLRFERSVDDPVVGIAITTPEGATVYWDCSFPSQLGHFDAGERAVCDIRARLQLPTGTYNIYANVCSLDKSLYDITTPVPIFVSGRPGLFGGMTDLAAQFEFHRSTETPSYVFAEEFRRDEP